VEPGYPANQPALSHDQEIQGSRAVDLTRSSLDQHDVSVGGIVEDADAIALNAVHERQWDVRGRKQQGPCESDCPGAQGESVAGPSSRHEKASHFPERMPHRPVSDGRILTNLVPPHLPRGA
jgi:hypothetical protein